MLARVARVVIMLAEKIKIPSPRMYEDLAKIHKKIFAKNIVCQNR